MRISRWQRRMMTGQGGYAGRSAESIPSETAEQIQVVNWIERIYPEVLFTASAGGMRTSIGTAKKMKAMGYKRGTPDLMFFEPRGAYHGLLIEMKRMKKSRTSDDQIRWIEELRTRKYKAQVCKGYAEATKVIQDYLEKGI